MSRFMKIGSLGTLSDWDLSDQSEQLSQGKQDPPTKDDQHSKF